MDKKYLPPEKKKSVITIVITVLLLLFMGLLIYLKTLAFGDRVANNMPNGASWWVITFYSCYYEFLIFGVIGFLLTAAVFIDKLYLKIIAIMSAAMALFLFLVDCAAKILFDQRVQFEQVTGYGKDASYYIDFIVYYFMRHHGHITFLIIVLFGALAFLCFKKNVAAKSALPAMIMSLLLVAGGGLLRLSPPKIVLPYYFINNLYQINRSTDEIPYSADFLFPDGWDLEYRAGGAYKTPKNVILLFVESLDYGLTSDVGGNSLVPNIEALSKEGISYTNYFSNNNNSSDARFTLFTGNPKLNGPVSYSDPHYYEHSFIKFLNKNNVDTVLFTAAPDLYGSDRIFKNTQFSRRVTFDDPVYRDEKRYVFQSVSDRAMFDNLLQQQISGQFREPYFAMAITATTHAPYQIPDTEEYSIDGCIKYTDGVIGDFVGKLKENGFFQNGLLVITGDHHSMRPVSPNEFSRYGLYESAHRVPLIIIGAGQAVEDAYLDHASLGVLISHLATGRYERNRFQYDPQKPEKRLVLAQPYFLQDTVLLFDENGKKTYTVHLDGDDTAFADENLNTEFIDYLYYIAWLRQNFGK